MKIKVKILQSYFKIVCVIIAALSPSIGNTQSVSWESAIDKVAKSAQEYSDYAYNKLGSRWVGPANNSIKYGVHQCAILGRFLGHSSTIRHIEKFEYLPLNDTSDPFDILVFSLTLENWVAAAKNVVAMKDSERRNVWNLECVGSMNIPSTLYIESVQPDASIKFDGDVLFVYGDIEHGFFDRFKEALSANPRVKQVALGSGGGSVKDAILAGLEIRKLGLTTSIHGNCFSACPLVFLGGKERMIWASSHRLGFHQIYSGSAEAVPPDDPIYGLTAQYLEAMGVNPNVVISWMLSATPHEMFIPESADLCGPGVATWVQRICGG